MSGQNDSKFHITMFPWFAIGHITPYLHLSNELAQRGHKISFLLPKKALLQLQHIDLHPNLITLHPISVPHVDGLPPGSKTASDIHISLSPLLTTAFDLTRDQVDSSLQALKPDFVFYDFAHWIPDLAVHIGFKTMCYMVVCAAALAFAFVPARKVPESRPFTEAELVEPPPGYPSSTVVLRFHEAKYLSFISIKLGSGMSFYERLVTSLSKCNAISIRTCRETEGPMCDYISTQYQKPVLLTGPVLPTPAQAPLEAQWAEWLSKFTPGSVIFCALGSQTVLEKRLVSRTCDGARINRKPIFPSH